MSSASPKLPPWVSGGLPVVGHLFEMLRDRTSLFKRGYQEHGPLFAVKLGPQPVLIITGDTYNRLFYTETDKSLNMQDGYAFLREAIGNVLFIADKDTYYNQRPVLQEVFKKERMPAYIQAMNIEVQQWLDSLGETGEIDLTAAMLQLTQQVAGRAFIGPNHAQELGPQFWREYDAISNSLDFILPPTWPLPKFQRRDQAKAKISQHLNQLIQQRRKYLTQHEDLITTLLQTPLKDGSYLPDELVVVIFMGLIFAGHETTAGQAAWSVALLLQHPQYLNLVQEEIAKHVHAEQPIDANTLSSLSHVYQAIDETTRLHPSADTQIRTVEQPLTFGEYEIPAGWRVMVSGATSHFQEHVYEQPERFDPMRYAPERAEGKNTYDIIGFGGGVHKCIGMNFAKNEMAIIIALLFQQFDIELLSQDIYVVSGKGANRPSEVRIRYHRKPMTALAGVGIPNAATQGCPHANTQKSSDMPTLIS